MSFAIVITDHFLRQFRCLTARQQAILEASIRNKLSDQADQVSKSIRKLRPNPLATFELRAQDLRALYNIEDGTVVILVIGRKSGNKLIVEGTEFHVHQDHPTQPTRVEPGRDAE